MQKTAKNLKPHTCQFVKTCAGPGKVHCETKDCPKLKNQGKDTPKYGTPEKDAEEGFKALFDVLAGGPKKIKETVKALDTLDKFYGHKPEWAPSNVNRPPQVEAKIQFKCPHCKGKSSLRSVELNIEHLEGNEDWNAETHIYAKCSSCGSKVEIQQ